MELAVDSLAARTAEALEFIRLLTHDDRSSHYVISRVVNGKWIEGRGMRASELESIDLSQPSPTYLSRNGFTSRRRLSSSCRQVNALLYDIDCHREGSRDAVTSLINSILSAAKDDSIPFPTMLVDTGRGVHVYYVLAQSLPMRVKGGSPNKSGMSLLRHVESTLGETIKRIIPDSTNATLDTTAYDLARVPGSYNDKAGCWCRLVGERGRFYSLGELLAGADPALHQHPKSIKKSTYRGGHPSPTDPATRRMLSKRLTILERLQELRANDCVGSREMICFLYYNTAKQLYSSKTAARMLNSLNARFDLPLPQAEVNHAIESVDHAGAQVGDRPHGKGFYVMKETTFLEKLGLSDDEHKALATITSKQAMRRRKKEMTARRRRLRDDRIARLYEIGHNQRDIAKMAGCCTRTVAKVVNRLGVKKGDLQKQRQKLHEESLKSKRDRTRMHIPAPESLCDAFRSSISLIGGYPSLIWVLLLKSPLHFERLVSFAIELSRFSSSAPASIACLSLI